MKTGICVLRARPPEEKAWRTAGNQMRLGKDLKEILLLEGGDGDIN